MKLNDHQVVAEIGQVGVCFSCPVIRIYLSVISKSEVQHVSAGQTKQASLLPL